MIEVMIESEKIKIGLVEDQFLFRKGIRAILESNPKLTVVFETGVGYDIDRQLNEHSTTPDVLLVDLCLPQDKNHYPYGGMEVTKTVRSKFPDIKILILSVHNEHNFIADLIRHGAHGYLIKDADPQEVIDAILAVHTRGAFINNYTLSAIQQSEVKIIKTQNKNTLKNNDEKLSRREIEILQLICEQMKTEEIANRLFISIKTVNGHRNNLLQKTGARNAAGLVTYAVRHRLYTVD
ncbi:DNA-binding response regulator [Chryseotalea sanaruensis]|uniref:DNA-binding response regulator n=2 Tax=Chryseotalea sanaruensis TaxID=2482724 RepID=A0A401U993_9BACT|nr:DNA-binding response regulator [Chryseotalea sanaruensis]